MDFPKTIPNVGLKDGRFIDENVDTGQAGSMIPSAWGNAVTDEMLAVIMGAGLVPAEGDHAQLLKAMRVIRGGALSVGQWAWSPSTAGNPGAAKLALNSVTPSAVTGLFLSVVNGDGLDYSPALSLLRAGDTICIKTRDSTAFALRYRVKSEAVDNGSYRWVPVEYVGGFGALPTEGAALQVLWVPTSAAEQSVDGIAGAFSNLKASANGTNGIVIASADALCVKNAANQQRVLNAVSISVNSASAGANGLDTGALTAAAWYALWVIYNPTTAAVAGLLSLSPTAPTMPPGYTFKARIGWVCVENNANKRLQPFIQSGCYVSYKPAVGANMTTYPAIANGTQGSFTALVAVSVGGVVPPTASHITMQLTGGSNSQSLVAPSPVYTGGITGLNSPPLNSTGSQSTNHNLQATFALEGMTIYYCGQSASCAVQCAGWRDNL